MLTIALALVAYSVASLAVATIVDEYTARPSVAARRLAAYVAQPTQHRAGDAERRFLASVRHATVRA